MVWQIINENFINPQPNPNSSTIVSPYDGDVVETDPSVCNGKIRIKHNINALPYYTEFCNVNRIKVRTGEFIRQNEVIGDLGDNNLKVYVYDNTGKKHSVSEFIRTSDKKPEVSKKEKTKNPDFDYVLLCNKICGSTHWNMQMKIIVDSPEDYAKWLAEQKTFKEKNMAQVNLVENIAIK